MKKSAYEIYSTHSNMEAGEISVDRNKHLDWKGKKETPWTATSSTTKTVCAAFRHSSADLNRVLSWFMCLSTRGLCWCSGFPTAELPGDGTSTDSPVLSSCSDSRWGPSTQPRQVNTQKPLKTALSLHNLLSMDPLTTRKSGFIWIIFSTEHDYPLSYCTYETNVLYYVLTDTLKSWLK